MSLLALLFTLAFAASAQAADPWPAATGGGGAGEANTTCSGAVYALKPVDGYYDTAATTMDNSGLGPTVFQTDDDCGEELDPDPCWDVVANTDPINEWGVCTNASLGGETDTIMTMEWNRAGGGTATFSVICDLSAASNTWCPSSNT